LPGHVNASTTWFQLWSRHFSFFSGISDETDVLLSMQGLKVMVIMEDMYQ
jgi:hypothetical protein